MTAADNSKILIPSAKYGWAALLTQCSLRSLIFLSWGSRVLCKPIFGHNQSSVQKIFTFSLKRGPLYCGSFNFLLCSSHRRSELTVTIEGNNFQWQGLIYSWLPKKVTHPYMGCENLEFARTIAPSNLNIFARCKDQSSMHYTLLLNPVLKIWQKNLFVELENGLRQRYPL